MAIRIDHREAGDRHRLASCLFSTVLYLAAEVAKRFISNDQNYAIFFAVGEIEADECSKGTLLIGSAR